MEKVEKVFKKTEKRYRGLAICISYIDLQNVVVCTNFTDDEC
jgi:hypothetical protein